MTTDTKYLTSRREILFLYDIKMGNPNGDPEENRPRVLLDHTNYVTDVRLKRFVRDFLKIQGDEILVDTVEGCTKNLTGRVSNYLLSNNLKQLVGRDLVNVLLDAFIDARLFGSSLAFKAGEKEEDDEDNTEDSKKSKKGKKEEWKPSPEPKTLTGAVQFNMGEVLHKTQDVEIFGTSLFSSNDTNKQGTFTSYFGLRYALVGFNGVANEHSAKISRMTDNDYERLLTALWCGIRSAGNTRTKVGQVPRLLVSIEYKPGIEFQFGNLIDYVKPVAENGKPDNEWSSPADYRLDCTLLKQRLDEAKGKIARVRFDISPDIRFATENVIDGWERLGIDA